MEVNEYTVCFQPVKYLTCRKCEAGGGGGGEDSK